MATVTMDTTINRKPRFEFCVFLILFWAKYISAYDEFIVQPVQSCKSQDVYDILNFKCISCGEWEDKRQMNFQQRDNDKGWCTCKPNYRQVARKDAIRLVCDVCPKGATRDGLSCANCLKKNCTRSCERNEVLVDREINGTVVEQRCEKCTDDSRPNAEKNRCMPCSRDPLNINKTLCVPCLESGYEEIDGECFQSSKLLPDSGSSLYKVQFSSIQVDSKHFRSNLRRAAYKCEYFGSLVACSNLLNLCSLQLFRQDLNESPCRIYSNARVNPRNVIPKFNLPPLYPKDKTVLTTKEIPLRLSFKYGDPKSVLPLKIAEYSINGTLLRVESATTSDLQICPVNSEPLIFGSWCSNTCSIKTRTFWDFKTTKFYELFVEYSEDNETKMYPVFIKVDGSVGRRFFLVDNLSGIPKDGYRAQVVRYAKSIVLSIQLRNGDPIGKIFAPIMEIEYDIVTIEDYNNNADLPQLSFRLNFWMEQEKIKEDMSVAMSIFSALAIICSAIQTWSWSKRNGRIVIDLYTLLKMILYLCGNLSTAFLFVISLVSLVRLMTYKEQSEPYMIAPTVEQERTLRIYIISAFVLKCVALLHLFYEHVRLDIFFIDWEKPRLSGQGETETRVSIWRNYYIAKEWKKLLTFRKTKNLFTLIALLFLLEVCKIENFALLKHSSTPSNGCEPFSQTFRFAIAVSFFFLIAFVQVVYFRLIHDNFIGDKITRFTDLCSICNVSVFVLSQRQHGYYIHGRSVHGHADTDMKQFNEHLKREEENLCTQRGLIPNTALQSFTVFVTRDFRQQFDKILRPALLIELPTGRSNLLLAVTKSFGNLGSLSEQFILAYQSMNKFLSTFIDHGLQDLDYIVKDKLLTEKLLDAEFEEPVDKTFFYNDPEHSFSNILFYRHELDLLMWEILLVSLIDIIASDFLLSVLLVILIYQVLEKLWRNRGQWNVARKSLLDKRFLL